MSYSIVASVRYGNPEELDGYSQKALKFIDYCLDIDKNPELKTPLTIITAKSFIKIFPLLITSKTAEELELSETIMQNKNHREVEEIMKVVEFVELDMKKIEKVYKQYLKTFIKGE